MGKHRDWTLIERDYQENGLSYAELAKKHNVPIDTLKKAAARLGWGKHRTVREANKRVARAEEKIRKAAETALEKAVLEETAPIETALSKNDTSENGTGAVSVYTETNAQRFDRSVYGLMDRVEEAIERVPPEAVQALKLLSTTLLDLQKLMGLNKDDLDREEQRARIDKLRSETRVVEEGGDNGVIILPPMDARPTPPGEDNA